MVDDHARPARPRLLGRFAPAGRPARPSRGRRPARAGGRGRSRTRCRPGRAGSRSRRPGSPSACRRGKRARPGAAPPRPPRSGPPRPPPCFRSRMPAKIFSASPVLPSFNIASAWSMPGGGSGPAALAVTLDHHQRLDARPARARSRSSRRRVSAFAGLHNSTVSSTSTVGAAGLIEHQREAEQDDEHRGDEAVVLPPAAALGRWPSA